MTAFILAGIAAATAVSSAASRASTPSCVQVPGELAADINTPVHLVLSSTSPTTIVWGGRPVADNRITATLCGDTPTFELQRADAATGRRESLVVGPTVSTVRVTVAWNRLASVRAAAVVDRVAGADVTQRLAACVDGIDNDGDGLKDEVDPGCSDLSDDSEDSDRAPQASNIDFKFASDNAGVYIESLTWQGKQVVVDPGTKGNRFYLHSDSGTSGKWTSDIQTYEIPQPNDPYHLPPQPWNPNTTTWKNQTSPTRQIGNADINSTIISQNDTTVVVNTTTPVAIFIDTFRFGQDTITITTDVTSLIPTTTCANGAATIYFGTHIGNLQLGTTTGCKCPATLISGHGSADGHGQANNCTAACASGLYHLDGLRRGSIQQGQPFDTMKWPIEPVTDPTQLKGWRSVAARGNAYPQSIFSPATALGDTKGFTIGMQMMNREINSDNTTTYTVEYYDIPAAPTKPLISQYVAASMVFGETHTFNYVVSFAPAGEWATPKPAVTKVLAPYAQYFATTFGSKPAYCPQNAIGMAFRGNGRMFNTSTHTYQKGSDLYNDVLGVDSYLHLAPPAGIDTAMIWQGQIYSALLMKHGSYEFNPNSQTLDPNVNECCDAKWTNVTKTLTANKLKLGWFGRPCSHIMQPDGKSPATVTCPGKTIEYGAPVPCNLQNLSDPCTLQSMATVDALVSKGVQNFYWDSYLCAGRLTFSQAVVKKYPHAFIMGEQGIDTDSVLTGGLPWMGMQAGVWDPSFEPMNSVLQEIVNPMGTAIVGAFGADQNVNHTMFSLQSSKTNSLMVLIPNDLQNIFVELPPNGKPPQARTIEMRTELCAQLKLSSDNAQWRWQQYGKAMGCPQPLQLDESICKPLPPIGYVCGNATAREPAKCTLGWPSTATNATCMASCKSTLGNCTKTGCVPCTVPGPKCTYTCHQTCTPHA